ncbi:uncharacterized protein LOC133193236 [Saccostrea echinata]|uniref:uncharacterized protein LOC133193236 n=1 Tax=Saccostrea echinata TaxID=191078 RepID=UPI002A8162F8|nr:uncharacterized protein LOC133193236 [Saccostrea echinata]
MNHILRLSESVYTGLCREVGTPTEVRIRREVMDTYHLSQRLEHKFYKRVIKWSGSKSEGFRLSTSDDDFMRWPLDHKVTCELSLVSFYYQLIPDTTVILMESDDLPPGFTRLNLMSPSSNTIIRSSCEAKNQKLYISSVLFRDGHLSLHKYNCPTLHTIPHGPCYTHLYEGGEIDVVWCLHSEEWPKNVLPWIQRCRQHNWPSEIVISEILIKGFHVVPIGSTPENGEEWRISFSQAEQKLIYSMNHCQFLCYGLLKIFLTEVINFQNNTPVICSYFTKTIVFWVIQTNNSLTWTPENLLYCFWACFKLLISWVRIGNCPNFFIPQNNMFRQKVTGSVQTSLFSQLYDLYCKGISCLLLSQTMRPYLSFAILNGTSILKICTLARESCIRCKRKGGQEQENAVEEIPHEQHQQQDAEVDHVDEDKSMRSVEDRQIPRRSTRERRKPTWMNNQEYVFTQQHSLEWKKKCEFLHDLKKSQEMRKYEDEIVRTMLDILKNN